MWVMPSEYRDEYAYPLDNTWIFSMNRDQVHNNE